MIGIYLLNLMILCDCNSYCNFFLIMKKIVFLALLILLSLAYPINPSKAITQCSSSIKNTLKKIENAFNQDKVDYVIDQIAQAFQQMPDTIGLCMGKQAKDIYSKELPPICINDMGRAAKILVKMANQTQNDFKFSRDAALFEWLYQTKLKKQCPILNETELEKIKSGGVCMQASYKFSLLLQQATVDIKKGDRNALYTDIDNIMSALPDLLDACGESKWAQYIRAHIPMDCVHAVQEFIAYLGIVQHNFMHFEWLVTHYRDIFVEFRKVKENCPLSQLD